MLLDYVHTYDADPERVVNLLRNEEFLDDVARHAGALEHSTSVEADTTRLNMALPVPSSLVKFVGQSIKISQIFRFEAPRADGSVHGTVSVDVTGLPVDVSARAQMLPKDGATEGRYTGELKVKIPLVGKKVEAQVEPFIRDAFDGLERRATDWLSR